MGTVTLRPAVPGDAPAATALARAAKAHWGYPAEWLDAWRDELSYADDYFARHRGWCAEVRGEPVGICALEEADGRWELAGLWVHPAHHGAGIGRALAGAARAAAGELRPGWPVRIASDPQAVGFYERLGARREGELPAPMPGAPERVLPLLWWDG